jgi:hypothetical protein
MAYHHDSGESQPLTKQGIGYDSNEDVHAALQLSFEDSPDHSLRSHEDQHHGDASPSRKAIDVLATSSAKPHHHHVHSHEQHLQQQQQKHHHQQQDNENRFPSAQQHPPQGYPYQTTYYPYQTMGTTASQGFPHYPTSAQGASAPTHFPGYPPHSTPGYFSQHWQSPPEHIQPAEYYIYPQHQQFQQQQLHQLHLQYSTPSAITPTGSRTPSKRKGLMNFDANATMETTELSFEDEMSGQVTFGSPPSSKKKKDVEAQDSASNTACDSPANVFRRGIMVRFT